MLTTLNDEDRNLEARPDLMIKDEIRINHRSRLLDSYPLGCDIDWSQVRPYWLS